MLEKFEHEDEQFHKWIQENRLGFVECPSATKNPRRRMLHLATCNHIQRWPGRSYTPPAVRSSHPLTSATLSPAPESQTCRSTDVAIATLKLGPPGRLSVGFMPLLSLGCVSTRRGSFHMDSASVSHCFDAHSHGGTLNLGLRFAEQIGWLVSVRAQMYHLASKAFGPEPDFGRLTILYDRLVRE
jgi:hypothetical protein